jgi:hypothetical protein
MKRKSIAGSAGKPRPDYTDLVNDVARAKMAEHTDERYQPRRGPRNIDAAVAFLLATMTMVSTRPGTENPTDKTQEKITTSTTDPQIIFTEQPAEEPEYVMV